MRLRSDLARDLQRLVELVQRFVRLFRIRYATPIHSAPSPDLEVVAFDREVQRFRQRLERRLRIGPA